MRRIHKTYWTSFGSISFSIVVVACVTVWPAFAQNQTPPNPGPNAAVTLTANLPCQWKLDGTGQGTLSQGGNARMRLTLGRHQVEAITDDGLDRWQQGVDVVGPEETTISIDLAGARANRLAAAALPDLMRTIQVNFAAWGASKISRFDTVEISSVIADPRACRLLWHERETSAKNKRKNDNRDHSIDLGKIDGEPQIYEDVKLPIYRISPTGLVGVNVPGFDAPILPTGGDYLLFRDKSIALQTFAALEQAIRICRARQ
jgi:hypothetical protein